MTEENLPDQELEETSEKKMERLEHEVKDFKDKYLRSLAEMENARKRMQKEKQDSLRFAISSALSEVLGPLDNLENAVGFAANMSEDVRNWATGFQMIVNQFKDILQSHGITAFESEGKMFDPHLHEAVEAEETEAYPEGTIIKEFVKGYKNGDYTVRPARVKVAKAPKELNNKQEKESQND